MDENNIPTLGYAPGPPRPMRNMIILAATLGAAGIGVTAAGILYRATQARTVTLGGSIVQVRANWQTQPAENILDTQPASTNESSTPTTRPAAGDNTQTTATRQ